MDDLYKQDPREPFPDEDLAQLMKDAQMTAQEWQAFEAKVLRGKEIHGSSK